MKVLGIGATGFIGQAVVGQLTRLGHEVAVLHRGKTAARLPDGVHSIRGDQNRLRESSAEIASWQPDAVLDAILYTGRQARETVEALRGSAGRLVVLSSADVYRNYDGLRRKGTAPPDPSPLAEGAPLRETRYPYRRRSRPPPDDPQDHSHDYEKIEVEEVVTSAVDLPATVLRLPAVYGPGDAQHRLRPHLQRMVDGRASILLEERQANWRWTRGFVENVAFAVALAIDDPSAAGRTYNVGDEPALTEREWALCIGRAAGWTGDVRVAPAAALPENHGPILDWSYDLEIDTSQIRRHLGYAEPVALDEALRRTVEWERGELVGAPSLDYADEDAALEALR